MERKINSFHNKPAYFHKQTPARPQALCHPSLTPSQSIAGPIPYWCQAGKELHQSCRNRTDGHSQGVVPHLLLPPCPINLYGATNGVPTTALTVYLLTVSQSVYLIYKTNFSSFQRKSRTSRTQLNKQVFRCSEPWRVFISLQQLAQTDPAAATICNSTRWMQALATVISGVTVYLHKYSFCKYIYIYNKWYYIKL